TQVGAVLVTRNAGSLSTGSQEDVVQLRNPLVEVVHPAENRLLVTSPVLERVVESHFLNTSSSLRGVGHQALDNTTLSRHVQAIRVDLAARGVFLVPYKAVAAKAESLQQGSGTAPVRVQLRRWPRIPRRARVFRLDAKGVRVAVDNARERARARVVGQSGSDHVPGAVTAKARKRAIARVVGQSGCDHVPDAVAAKAEGAERTRKVRSAVRDDVQGRVVSSSTGARGGVVPHDPLDGTHRAVPTGLPSWLLDNLQPSIPKDASEVRVIRHMPSLSLSGVHARAVV